MHDPVAAPGDAAFLDESGLLRVAGRWVAIPDTQLPVVDLLLRRLGSVVRTEELLEAHRDGGGSGTAASMRPLVHRLRRRFDAVGLTLHVVRGRGVMVEPTRVEVR